VSTILPLGIASSEAFGSSTFNPNTINPAGISEGAFGTPLVFKVEEPKAIAEAIVVGFVDPEAPQMLAAAVLLGDDTQDITPSGRVQNVLRGTGRVTWEEP